MGLNFPSQLFLSALHSLDPLTDDLRTDGLCRDCICLIDLTLCLSALLSARTCPKALIPISPASNAGVDSHPSEAIPGANHIVPVTKISQEKKCRPDRFSEHQLRELWARFEVTRYLTTEQAQSLSSQLGLTMLQVRNWFRNHRKKYKLWIAPRLQTPVRISVGDMQGATPFPSALQYHVWSGKDVDAFPTPLMTNIISGSIATSSLLNQSGRYI
ncbi:homeobox protein DLX-4-like [Ornithorhynchus anatinus]|uniref:homeobox protein DLX-4-like n=1 Tax=Ornithorhynchus anatinus TaxID=9258 RepID=UPI0019D4DC4F|nr:homeobox protein DLX-4-like [Ornithorhynchus anatinus]